MIRTKMLFILPLLVGVTYGEANPPYEYYGSSNVRDQRPEVLGSAAPGFSDLVDVTKKIISPLPANYGWAFIPIKLGDKELNATPEAVKDPVVTLPPKEYSIAPEREVAKPTLATPPARYLRVDFQCKERNGFYAIANECDTFIECKENVAYKFLCPNGLHFNPAAKHYDYPCASPSEVKCVAPTYEEAPASEPTSQPIPVYEQSSAPKPIALPAPVYKQPPAPEPVAVTTPVYIEGPATAPKPSYQPPAPVTYRPNPTTPPSGYYLRVDFQCKEINGFYAIANKCDTFIECKENEAYKFLCPDGLHFNPAAKHYDYPCAKPSEVKCVAPTYKEAPAPEQTSQLIPVYEQSPAPKPIALPAPVYRQPSGPEPVAVPTPVYIEGPAPARKPSYQPPAPVTYRPDPTTYRPNPTTQPSGYYLRVDFKCKEINGFYAIANECDTFIECKENVAYKFLCPDGLHFNPAAKHYDYPCANPSEVKCVAPTYEEAPAPEPTSQLIPVYEQSPAPKPIALPAPVYKQPPAPEPVAVPTPVYVEAPAPAPEPTPQPTPVYEQPPAPKPIALPAPVYKQPPAPEPVAVPTPVYIEAPAPAPEPTPQPTPVYEQPPAPKPIALPAPVYRQPAAPEPVAMPTPVYIEAPAPAPEPTPQPTPVYEQPPAPKPIALPAPAYKQPPAPEPVAVPTPVYVEAPEPAPEPTAQPAPVYEQPPAPKPIALPAPVYKQPPAPEPVAVPTPVYVEASEPAPEPTPQPAPIYEQPPAPKPIAVLQPVYEQPPAPVVYPQPAQPAPAPLQPFSDTPTNRVGVYVPPVPLPSKPESLPSLLPKPEHIREIGFIRNPVTPSIYNPEPSYVVTEPPTAPPTEAPITNPPTPVTYPPAPVTYPPAPVTYPPAPVTYRPEPVTYPPAPVTYRPAPVTYRPDSTTYRPNPATPPSGYFRVDFQCQERNAYYAVANECDSFIECKDNVAYKFLCPDGLHFNPVARHYDYPCAYPSEVKCTAGATEQNPKSTEQCLNQYGYYAIKDSDCSRYIMCQEGLATIMQCPMGLVFNAEISSCDWPINVPPCNPDVFKDFTCPAPPQDENGQVSEIIYKYRYENQCKHYIACQMGHPRLLSCADGLSFHEESQSCVEDEYVNCAAPSKQ